MKLTIDCSACPPLIVSCDPEGTGRTQPTSPSDVPPRRITNPPPPTTSASIPPVRTAQPVRIESAGSAATLAESSGPRPFTATTTASDSPAMPMQASNVEAGEPVPVLHQTTGPALMPPAHPVPSSPDTAAILPVTSMLLPPTSPPLHLPVVDPANPAMPRSELELLSNELLHGVARQLPFADFASLRLTSRYMKTRLDADVPRQSYLRIVMTGSMWRHSPAESWTSFLTRWHEKALQRAESQIPQQHLALDMNDKPLKRSHPAPGEGHAVHMRENALAHLATQITPLDQLENKLERTVDDTRVNQRCLSHVMQALTRLDDFSHRVPVLRELIWSAADLERLDRDFLELPPGVPANDHFARSRILGYVGTACSELAPIAARRWLNGLAHMHAANAIVADAGLEEFMAHVDESGATDATWALDAMLRNSTIRPPLPGVALQRSQRSELITRRAQYVSQAAFTKACIALMEKSTLSARRIGAFAITGLYESNDPDDFCRLCDFVDEAPASEYEAAVVAAIPAFSRYFSAFEDDDDPEEMTSTDAVPLLRLLTMANKLESPDLRARALQEFLSVTAYMEEIRLDPVSSSFTGGLLELAESIPDESLQRISVVDTPFDLDSSMVNPLDLQCDPGELLKLRYRVTNDPSARDHYARIDAFGVRFTALRSASAPPSAT